VPTLTEQGMDKLMHKHNALDCRGQILSELNPRNVLQMITVQLIFTAILIEYMQSIYDFDLIRNCANV